MTYDWVYLCNNPRRLAITLRCLPPEPFDGLRYLNVCWCSHLDPFDRGSQLEDTIVKHKPNWLRWRVRDVSPLIRHSPKELDLYFANGKKRWSLGVKLLLPFLIDGPMLYTDDDVVVGSDPYPLIAEGPFGSKGCFRFAGKKLHIVQQLRQAFDIDLHCPDTIDISWMYDDHALDAGVFFLDDRRNWAERLERFAALPYIAALTTHNLELRCLDQRFLTMFGIEHGWRQQRIGNGFAPPHEIRPSLLARHPFFHYKSQSKDRWMQRFEEYLAR